MADGPDPITLLVGGVVVAVIAGVVIAVYETFSPTAQACNNPASPCGAAITPLVAQFNQCAKNYNSASASFLAEDSCAGSPAGCVPTAFTQVQLDYLKTQLDCMNTLATQIGNTATKFAQNPLDTLATFLGEAALIGIPSYLIAKAYLRYRANRTQTQYTSYDWGSANLNATIEAMTDLGQINSEAGAQWVNSFPQYNSTNISSMNQALLTYTNLQFISQIQLQEIEAAQSESLAFDLDTLLAVLP